MRLNIQLDLTPDQAQRQLMAGLDRWVQLGLLSEAQVKEIAATLSQPLPEMAKDNVIGEATEEAVPVAMDAASGTTVAGVADVGDVAGDGPKRAKRAIELAVEPEPEPEPEPVRALPQRVSWVSRSLAALFEEISVIWLLVLGVFLVVVSSGVLAASQWDSFSAVGQYGILFAYTLAFWAASAWAQKQENLQSTGRMLALTTLLLVPVNFWVIDRFGVLTSPLGIGMGGIAAIALTGLPFFLSTGLMPRRANQLNLIGLSWLHWGWGWGWAIWPAIAIYLGTIGTATNLTAQDRRQSVAAIGTPEEALLEEASEEGLSFGVLAVALSMMVLIARGLLIGQVPPHQLGLAAGICGWLLVRLTRDRHSRIVWERAGFGLLGLGWLTSVSQSPPWQAIAVSLLTLSLLWNRLQSTWHRLYLLAMLGVGLQTYGLSWAILTPALRDRLLGWLAVRFDVGTVTALNWAGVGLFPYLLLMLVFSRCLHRQQNSQQNARQNLQQNRLSQLTQQLALALGFSLAIISASNPFTAAITLSLCALTIAAVLRWHLSNSAELMALAHGASLLAITSWIQYFAPELSIASWARVVLGGAITHFFLHLYLRHPLLQRNFWWAGIGLSTISYGLLIDSYSGQPHWLWLIVPVTLTVMANHRRTLYPQMAAGIALSTLVLHAPWLGSWTAAITAFTAGTLCAAINSRVLRDRFGASFTIGMALLLASSLVWVGLIRQLDNSVSRMMIFWVIEIGSLWLIQRGLMRRSNEMALLYVHATRTWAALMLAIFLFWGTAVAATTVAAPVLENGLETTHTRYLLAATCILIAALAEFIRYRPMEWRYCSLAWAVEISLVIGLKLQGSGPVKIGIVTLALAFVTQVIADVWVIRHPPYRRSWHYIPLAYAVIGLVLGHLSFQANTGFFTLAAGILLLGIGRRQANFEGFSYAGLAAISAGAYELIVYRLLQVSGGYLGDGITLLAGLALAIAALYQICRPWVPAYLRLSAPAISLAGHGHWVIGSVLCLFAAIEGLSQPQGITLWTGCSLLLAGYALAVGNRRWRANALGFSHSGWTGIGLAVALLCVAYDRYSWFPDRARLLAGGGGIACAIGLLLYAMPWERLGWSQRPWQRLSLWLPMLTLGITLAYVQTQGLLIVAAFYAWMAKQRDRVRLSYLSLLLLDFSLLEYLDSRGWLTYISFGLMFGLSVLYIAEVEPYLQDDGQNNAKRQQRHWLRMLASGLIGLSALYQTEISERFLGFAAIALVIGIAFIFAGLILKVRAFLYAGTATFITQILRVLWLFISANSLLLWAVGIVLGLVFIWVAATFESRRSQLGTRLSSWTSALETWD